jgi:small subunit ribosomal protein S3
LSGHIKFCGETALELMDVGIAQAKLKPGTIGVKVAIMKPDARLPDEIEVAKPEIPATEEEEETEEAKEEEDSKEKPKEKETKKESKGEEKKEEGEKK